MGEELDREDAKAAGSLGAISPIWCLCAIPHREPKTGTMVWTRTNGSVTMRLRPGLIDAGTAKERWAYPFGVIPRHLLAWVETEVKRGGHAWHPDTLTLDLGGSMNALLRMLGYEAGYGKRGNGTRLRDQITRLAYADLIVTETREHADGAWNHRGEHFGFFGGVNLWWSEKRRGNDTLSPNTIRLSAEYAAAIKDRAVPIDLRALRNLQVANAGPLAIDLYYWLVRRVFGLNHGKRTSALITWEQLATQTGGQYARTRSFKEAVLGTRATATKPRHLGALSVVQACAYRTADVTVAESGLIVKRSPLPVEQRHIIDL
jgi:hypothetical protein